MVWRGRTDVGVKKCEWVYGRAEGGLPPSPDVVQPLMTRMLHHQQNLVGFIGSIETCLGIEVEGISRVGGQVGEERHSGSIRLVHKHGISMLQNVVDGASMPHREG